METVNSAKKLLESLSIKAHLPSGCNWWSKYIYHFSHVTNVASILNDGLLRSRNQVKEMKGKVLNDNASKEVISGTEDEYKDYVRFYFRPLTPTQYHNEGVRAKNEITELGAHCPVPIFLLFDTEMLDESNVFFSYESLASHYEVPLYQGVQKLSEAPFNYIYHNDSTSNLDGNKIRKHRQAEVVIKNQCNLQYLRKIVCRTKAEADTLKHLLGVTAYLQYIDMICVIGDSNFDTKDATKIFHGNFLKIINVQQNKSNCDIEFNKVDFNSRNIGVYWFDKSKEVICEFTQEDIVLSQFGNKLRINLFDNLKLLDYVGVKITLDSNMIYCNGFEI